MPKAGQKRPENILMESLKDVSIVMPFKNTAPYLRECLDSIVNQSHRDWELIAVDDHSTDESARIVKDYALRDSRIKYHISEGQRLIPALQTAFKHSRYQLINRMDSDDRMPLDKLETLVNKWNQYGRGYVMAGGTQHFKDDGKVEGGFRRYDSWLNQIAKRE